MATPLEFLTAVYMNDKLPLPTRMKAAVEAAQYVHPKLTAVANYNVQDFADELERRRAARMKVISAPPMIEATREGSQPSAREVSASAMGQGFAPSQRRV
jgi:hypothetical protein